MKMRNWMLGVAVVLITVLPLVMFSAPPAAPGAEAQEAFGGADARAQQAIGDIAPGYEPWFTPVFEPASGEIASLLFALQAAIGAGVIGFWLGLSVARDRARRELPAAAAAAAQDARIGSAGHAALRQDQRAD